jgi:hypothetical protein
LLDPLPQLTIALSLATLFAAAAAHKLLAAREWPGVVRNYRLVPDVLAGTIAALIILAETLTAGALLWPPAQRAGAAAAAALLVAYAVAIGINVARGRTRIDCGCFGSRLRQGIAPWMVARNLVLAVLALTLLLPAAQRPLSVAEVAIALATVVTLGFLYPVLAIVARPTRLPGRHDEAASERASR